MANLFKERLKAADATAVSNLVAPDRQAGQAEAITFQQLSPSGSFVRTVTAIPGTITVVQERPKSESFREALLGNDKTANLNIRCGNQELHRTEISLAGTTAQVLEAATLKDALKNVGVPESRLKDILREIGLENSGDVSPKTLSAQSLKRLAVAAALFHRSRIVHLDRPFSGVDQVWVERLARLLIEAGELPTRVLVITGEATIPSAWKDHPRVMVNDIQNNAAEIAIPTQRAVSNGLQTLARTMLSAGALLREPTGEIITRPQMIYPAPRPGGREALQSEAITNPHVELPQSEDAERQKITQGIENVQAEKRAREAEEATHSSKKTPSGKLTRVTRVLRIRQSGPANWTRNAVKKVRASFDGGPREEALLPPVKRTMFQVKNLKRKRLIIGASALVIVLYGLWIWGAIHYRQQAAARAASNETTTVVSQ